MTTAPTQAFDCDYLLVGGGLQNALILLALADRKPDARVILLERDARLGGNHIWSFQALDLPASTASWSEPLIQYRWPGYQLHFDGNDRWIEGTYHSISSEHLDAVVQSTIASRPNIQIRSSTQVSHCEAQAAVLADGQRITGRLVIDARGPNPNPPPGGGGFQKFVGLECRLKQPTHLTAPVLMDTRCPQRDGFRFLYVLPFTPDRVLIEDTFFSNSPELAVEQVREGALRDALGLDLEVAEILRTEVGILPMPSRNAFKPAAKSPILAGYAGGWFNAGTGYSLAAASRLAEHLATTSIEDVFGADWKRLTRKLRMQSHFLAFLNLLMFGFFHDNKRSALMERFYLLPDAVVHRFFAMEMSARDMWRIMYVGAPWTPKGWGRRARFQGDASARSH